MCFSLLRKPSPPPHKRLLPCHPRYRCWLVASGHERFRSLHRRRMDGKGAPSPKGSSATTTSLRISVTLTLDRRATKRAREASPVRCRRLFTRRGGLPPKQKPPSCPPSDFFFFIINIVNVIIIIIIVAGIRARLVRSSRTPPMPPAPPPLRRETKESTPRYGVVRIRRTRHREGGSQAG